MNDISVMGELAQLSNENKELAYLTLVALFVLQEEFEDRESEWKLLA